MVKAPAKVWVIVFLLLIAGQKAWTQNTISDSQKIGFTDLTGINAIKRDSIDAGKLKNDSITAHSDSIKKETLEAPVYMTAKDSMVMVMDSGNILYLYGSGTAKYQGMSLEAEQMKMDADSSKLYAHFGLDSIGTKFGFPSFKSGDQESEMEEVWYNFKSRKMFSRNVITQQGEGYITAEIAKKMPDDSYYLLNGKYTTCDLHEHPHFYFDLTKARLRPGKNVTTGPIYLVVEDVPLPIAFPFFYFPTTKSYHSGILMPNYGDEMARGFSLRDGGYYFAFSDYVDLALTGELYTKGSWGLSARSQYSKLYKFRGSFDMSYLVTITGDKDSKDLPNSDYSKSKDMKIVWNHSQDPKSNPYGTFTANVNFSTSSYYQNNFQGSTYDERSQNTKSSSVNYSYHSLTLPLSITASSSVNQVSRDSTLSVSFPDVSISMSTIYPFKRKEQIGSQRWYEKINLSYTGRIQNSINNVKENQFLNKSIIKDWKNAMTHSIPISASFNLLKYIMINTSVKYNENWYTNRSNFGYDYTTNRIVPIDTVYGFFRAFDYSGSVSMNTKLYGMYKPWSLFGKWTKGIQIRHVLTPTVSFNGAPDFSDPRYGMYQIIRYYDNSTIPQLQTRRQSFYQNNLFGMTSVGRTGSVSFGLDNNLEAKVPIAETDSTRKISIIDNFGVTTSYNFLADSMNWSNLSVNLRLKLFKSNLNLSGQFDPYVNDVNGNRINTLRMNAGKGIGHFLGTSTSYSYTLNNESINKLFKKGENNSSTKMTNSATDNNGKDETTGMAETDENTEAVANPSPQKSLLNSKKKEEGSYDSDGYYVSAVKWSFTINYSINLYTDRNIQNFNRQTREYPYRISQTMGFSGNISPTKAWAFTFNGSYDFAIKSIASLSCSISRQMHCWSMSATIVPIGPYQNYGFLISVNSSLLKDVKYQQSSNYRDAQKWGN